MSPKPRHVLRFADGGWAESVGGHVALDLVNTVAWRLQSDRTVDRLADAPAVVDWARFTGLLDDEEASAGTARLAGDPDAADRLTRELRTLREELYRVLGPLAVGEEPVSGDVEALRRRLVEAWSRAEIGPVMPLQWSSGHTVLDLPVELALAAGRLLADEDPARLRQCRDDACGWLFLDRSRNASRVWCSSADCGNRMRARRHHQRHSSAPRPAGGVIR